MDKIVTKNMMFDDEQLKKMLEKDKTKIILPGCNEELDRVPVDWEEE